MNDLYLQELFASSGSTQQTLQTLQRRLQRELQASVERQSSESLIRFIITLEERGNPDRYEYFRNLLSQLKPEIYNKLFNFESSHGYLKLLQQKYPRYFQILEEQGRKRLHDVPKQQQQGRQIQHVEEFQAEYCKKPLAILIRDNPAVKLMVDSLLSFNTVKNRLYFDVAFKIFFNGRQNIDYDINDVQISIKKDAISQYRHKTLQADILRGLMVKIIPVIKLIFSRFINKNKNIFYCQPSKYRPIDFFNEQKHWRPDKKLFEVEIRIVKGRFSTNFHKDTRSLFTAIIPLDIQRQKALRSPVSLTQYRADGDSKIFKYPDAHTNDMTIHTNVLNTHRSPLYSHLTQAQRKKDQEFMTILINPIDV